MNRRITVKYCFLQGGYWTLAAVAMAFTTPLLEAKGFSGTEIGILSAVKYLAVLIFQMVLGSFADKHAEKVPLQRMLILMTFVNIIFSFLFYLTGHTMWMAMLTLIVFGMTIHCASPLVDSLSIQYMNHGVKMNYAISRACGSLCWAVFCVVVGLIADAFGTNRILIFQIVVSFLFAFFACFLAFLSASVLPQLSSWLPLLPFSWLLLLHVFFPPLSYEPLLQDEVFLLLPFSSVLLFQAYKK